MPSERADSPRKVGSREICGGNSRAADPRHPFRGRGCAGLSAVLLLIPILGCDAGPPRLYCGAGLQGPVAEIVGEFNRQRDVTIQCDFRGSEHLLSSIKLTGEGDLYMPGDVHYVELAEKEGLVASKKTVCYFIPVILVAKGNPKNIHTLADLTRPEVRVGLGDPEACAIGRKASRIFAKNDVDQQQVNVVVRTVTVNELGNYVKLGTLDAAIVWDAVAAMFPDEAQIVPIPRQQNVISTVAIGILTSSKHPELAKDFVDFITSPRGKEVFRRHHYSTTGPESR